MKEMFETHYVLKTELHWCLSIKKEICGWCLQHFAHLGHAACLARKHAESSLFTGLFEQLALYTP